jgi:hypothetical protein
MGRGMECRSAGMADMGGHMRAQARAAADPAAGNMRTAHMNGPAAHVHGAAAAKMNAATPATEVSTATSTTEVTTAATAAEMSAPAPAATSCVSRSRQTKGKAYCGRACCDFPHDTTSSSGPNAQCQRQITRSVPAERSSRCCNAHVTLVYFARQLTCGQLGSRARPLRLNFFSHAITIAGTNRSGRVRNRLRRRWNCTRTRLREQKPKGKFAHQQRHAAVTARLLIHRGARTVA